MFGDKKGIHLMVVLCTICARGGSKGVPGKNIRLLHGKPLIAHTIEQALNVKLINKVMVSTDDAKIVDIAKQYGAEVPFIRPAELAIDSVSKIPVLRHVIEYYAKNMNYKPDYIVDLDPTSPLRETADIERCMDLIKSGPDCDSVITGYWSNKNPYFNMVEINKEGFAELSKSIGVEFTSRQNSPAVFAMNASIYVWRTEALMNSNKVISGKVKFFEMPEERSIDIDSEIDFKLVELLLEGQK